MERNIYTVYRVLDLETGDRREVSSHYTEGKAIDRANAYHSEDGACYTVDVDLVSISRAGREILDSTADIYAAGREE